MLYRLYGGVGTGVDCRGDGVLGAVEVLVRAHGVAEGAAAVGLPNALRAPLFDQLVV